MRGLFEKEKNRNLRQIVSFLTEVIRLMKGSSLDISGRVTIGAVNI